MTTSDAAFSMFHSEYYLAHTQARLAHLNTLELPLYNRSVLEPGAGIGDHTLFYLARGCTVTAIEPRPENCAAFRKHLAAAAPRANDRWSLVEGDVSSVSLFDQKFEIVHCYGLLYHLATPANMLSLLSACCDELMIVETCVSFGDSVELNPIAEPAENLSQAYDGVGCRPTRAWVFAKLGTLFSHVYTTTTQPAHPEFPTDWTRPEKHGNALARSVFVASRRKLDYPSLTAGLPAIQPRIAPIPVS